jgi:hypothetical protein
VLYFNVDKIKRESKKVNSSHKHGGGELLILMLANKQSKLENNLDHY